MLGVLVNVITEIEKSGGDSLYIIDLCERILAQPIEQLPVLSVYVQYLIHKKADEKKLGPLLHRMLSIEPENKMAQLQLLSYAIGRKDYSEIIARSDTAIQYNPDILQLYYYRGIACYQLKKKQEKFLQTQWKFKDLQKQNYTNHMAAQVAKTLVI